MAFKTLLKHLETAFNNDKELKDLTMSYIDKEIKNYNLIVPYYKNLPIIKSCLFLNNFNTLKIIFDTGNNIWMSHYFKRSH